MIRLPWRRGHAARVVAVSPAAPALTTSTCLEGIRRDDGQCPARASGPISSGFPSRLRPCALRCELDHTVSPAEQRREAMERLHGLATPSEPPGAVSPLLFRGR